jgi:hypothetical protein
VQEIVQAPVDSQGGVVVKALLVEAGTAIVLSVAIEDMRKSLAETAEQQDHSEQYWVRLGTPSKNLGHRFLLDLQEVV